MAGDQQEAVRTQQPTPQTTPTSGDTSQGQFKQDLRGVGYAEGQAKLQARAPGAAPPSDPSADLKQTVRGTRADQIKRIRDHLDDMTITNGDVEKVLRILEPMDGPTIVAVMGALPSGMLQDFVENINSPHVGRFRREVLESCFAAAPRQLRDIDTDVIEDMNLDGLSPREQLQVGYILRNLKKGDLKDLVESKNGPKVKAIMSVASSYSADDFRKDNAAALAKEKGRDETAAQDKQALADKAVQQKVSSMADTLDDFIVTDAEATRILDWMAAYLPNTQTIGAIARDLEHRGRLDRFVDELPSKVKWQKGPRSQAFLVVLQSRPPDKNVAMAESLLSYGVFDWAITDEEARMAYHLVKSAPPAVQDKFRRADNAKWFVRMEHEQARDVVVSGEYRGVETRKNPTTGEVEDVAETYAKKLEEKPTADLFQKILALCEAGVEGETAAKIYAELGAQRDKDAVGAVVRRLDTLGHVDPLLSALGHEALFAEKNRPATLRILAARDPEHQKAHARELLSLGVFDWAVTSEEALLAFHMIKALPAAERQAFMTADGGAWWAKIQGEMTQQERESRATHFYEGGEDGGDQTSIRAQLLEDGTWTREGSAKLDALVRMAQAAGDGAWVFEESEKRKAFEAVPDVVKKHHLFHLKDQPKYDPEVLAGTNYWHEGPIGTIGTLGSAVGFLHASKDVETAQYLGGEGLSLTHLQDVMGGNISGVRFAELDTLGKDGEDARENKKGANFADAKWDLVNGVLDVDAPDLRIAAIQQMVGETRITTGEGAIKGLKVTCRYPTAANPKPVYVEVVAQQITLADLLVINPGSMQAANKLDLNDLFFKLGRPGVTKDDIIKAHDENRVPAPLIGGMISSLTNVVDVIFADDDAKAMTDGFKDPKSQLGAEIRIGGLNVDGIQTSSGQSVRQVTLKNLRMAGGQTKSAFVQAKIDSLGLAAQRAADRGDQAAVARIEGEQKDLRAKLDGLVKREAELFALQDAYAANPAAFTPAQQEQLDALQKELEGGGWVVDIDAIEMAGIDGKVKADDVKLGGLHGEGAAQGMGFSMVTDQSLIEGFVKKGAPAPASGPQPMNQDAKATIELGTVEVTNLSVKGGIPKLGDVDARVAVLKQKLARDSASETERKEQAELVAMRPRVARYEELVQIGLTSLNPGQKSEFQALRSELGDRTSLSVKRLALEGATAEVGVTADLSGGSVKVGAKKLSATGIEAGGVSVDKVEGTDVSADAAAGGLGSALDVRSALTGAGVRAGELTIEGVRDQGSDVSVGRIHAKDLGVTLSDANTDARVGVKAGSIEVDGISLAGRIRALEGEYAKLSGTPEAELDAGKRARLAELTRTLKEHATLKGALAAARGALDEAKGTAREASAEAEVARAQKALDSWSQVAARVSVKDVDLVVSGLGNVASADWKASDAMDGGVTLQGKGGADGHTAIGSVVVEGAKGADGKAQTTRLEGLSGGVTVSSDRVKLDGVGLAGLSVSGLDWSTGGMSARVTGTAGLRDLKIQGEVTLRDVIDPKTGEKTKAADSVSIESFSIGEIYGSGVHVDMPDKGVSVDMPKGSLTGIWAKGVSLKLPQKEGESVSVSGSAGVKGVDIPAIQAKVGKALSYNGSLSLSELSVSQMRDGKRTLELGNLDAHGMVTAAAGTAFKVDVSGLAGKVVQHGDSVILSGVRLADLTLGNAHWSGGGRTVDIGKKASMKGLRVDARIRTKQVGEGAAAKTELAECVISNLSVASIEAEDLHASVAEVKADAAKGIEAQAASRVDLPKATIQGLRVTGLDLMAQTGDVHLDRADVTGLHATVGRAGKSAIEATASMHAEGLDLTLLGPNRQIIDLGRGDISATLGADGSTASIDAKGLHGKVEMGPDSAVLSGVGLESLGFSKIAYRSPDKSLSSPKGGFVSGVVLERAELKWEDKPPARPGAKGERVYTSMLVKELRFQKLTSDTVVYDGSSVTDKDGRTVTLDTHVQMAGVSMRDLRLRELNADLLGGKTHVAATLGRTDVKGLQAEYKRATKGQGTHTSTIMGDLFVGGMSADITAQKVTGGGHEGTALTGNAKLTGAGLSDFSVKRDGDTVVSGDKVDMDAEARFLDDGRTAIDATRMSGQGVKLSVGKGTITLADIQAKGGHVELDANREPTWAIVPEIAIGGGKSSLAGITYTDPSGVVAHVRKGLAKDVRCDWKAGKLVAAKVGSVRVDDGDFEMPAAAMGGSGDKSAPAGPLPLDWLSGVNGTVNFEFYWWYRGPISHDRGFDNTEHLSMKITKGSFDAKALEDQFGTLVDWFGVDFEQKGNKVGLEIGDDTVWTELSPAGARAFDKHGTLSLKALSDLVTKYGKVVKAKPAEADPKLYLPMDRVNYDADLTMDPGTEIALPGMGKVKIGKPAGGKNKIAAKGSPATGMTLDMAEFALDSVDWKTAGLKLSTGHIELAALQARYDIAKARLSGSLKSATMADIKVSFE